MNPSDIAPLTPPDCDLSDFKFMPLEVQRLRKSRAWLICKRRPDLAFYMINLWTASWHEQPAGSLEDDDDVLADLAMCDPAKWSKLRNDVLRGWVKCSDGRLYNKTVCEKANEAWTSKLVHHYERAKERLRKQNKSRVTQGQVPLVELTFDQWNACRIEQGVPMEKAECSAGIPATLPASGAGIPPENALKGEGQGEGQGQGEGEGQGEKNGNAPGGAPASAGKAAAKTQPPAPPLPPPPDASTELTPVETIFAVGVPLLTQHGVAERNARSFLGHLRKVAAKNQGGDAAVVAALERCVREQALVPIEFLQGCFKGGKLPGAATPTNDTAARDAEARRLLGFGAAPSAEIIDA